MPKADLHNNAAAMSWRWSMPIAARSKQPTSKLALLHWSSANDPFI